MPAMTPIGGRWAPSGSIFGSLRFLEHALFEFAPRPDIGLLGDLARTLLVLEFAQLVAEYSEVGVLVVGDRRRSNLAAE